jgi:hypothetical protein
MTVILNTIVNQQILSSAFGAISNELGLIAVVLLLALLVERVLLDAYAGERWGERLRVFNTATLPLLIALAVIVIMRFIQVLQTS